MFGPALAVVVLLSRVAAEPAADPAILVDQLGSFRFSERERAEARLSILGRFAIPALRVAKTSKDLEIRTRAGTILARIEDSLLTEPTAISLDLNEVRIADALRSIARESGSACSADAEGDQGWAERRFSLRPGGPLPYWKAIDALCEAGRAHYVFRGPATAGGEAPSLSILEGRPASADPTSDHGPFRVQVAGVHPQMPTEIHFSQARPGMGGGFITTRGLILPARGPVAPASRPFYLQLLVAAEPRLSIAQSGAVRVTEAFDESGRPFIIPNRSQAIQHTSAYFGMTPSTVLRLRVDLAQPEGSGQRIKRIKGVVPVGVATRRPDPLVLPLDAPLNQPVRDDEVSITVSAIRPQRPGQPCMIELALKSFARSPFLAQGLEGNIGPDRPDSPLQQIEVLDARDRPLPWFPKEEHHDGEQTRLVMTILPVDGLGPPATIRRHGMIRGATEIPFEFRDIPMPPTISR